MERPMLTISLRAAGAVLGWCALIFQLYLFLVSSLEPVGETLVRYFTFFTILTNLLVAVGQTVLWLAPGSGWGRFFRRSGVQTAMALYILVVGLTYNTLLRFLWDPQGLQRVVDELLHTVNPLLYLLYWFACVSKWGVRWGMLGGWLIYPLVYLLVVMTRGYFSGYYPYPFLNLDKLGTQLTIYSICGMSMVFVVFGLALIGIARLRAGASAA